LPAVAPPFVALPLLVSPALALPPVAPAAPTAPAPPLSVLLALELPLAPPYPAPPLPPAPPFPPLALPVFEALLPMLETVWPLTVALKVELASTVIVFQESVLFDCDGVV